MQIKSTARFWQAGLQCDSQYANLRVVTVLSKRRIEEFIKQNGDAGAELRNWFAIARKADWRSHLDVRTHFPEADQVGRMLVFNIRHNRFRLVVKVDYRSKLLMVKALLTHQRYDRGGWEK